MAHPKTYDDGTTYVGFHRPAMVKHTVSANEESSGLANITMFPNPTNTDRDMGFISQITDSSDVIKENSGIVMDYRPTSGVVRVECAPGYLAENDVITIIGMKYV